MKYLLLLFVLAISFLFIYIVGKANYAAYDYCLAHGGNEESCQVAFQ